MLKIPQLPGIQQKQRLRLRTACTLNSARYHRAVNLSLIAASAVMIYPKTFCSNPDTLESNSFQSRANQSKKKIILENSQKEFLQFQKKLTENGIQVLAFEEDISKFTPDALFPNNWFCQMPDGRVFLFPMFPKNRRDEYRSDIVGSLKATEIIDLRYLEKENLFLEGTGSLILDHASRTAFACLSPRTSSGALTEFSKKSGYKIVNFSSVALSNQPVYHTNVMMALSPKNAVICLESIKSAMERERITSALHNIGKNIIDISYNEMNSFAGNILFLRNSLRPFWICSSRAYKALSAKNRFALEEEAPFIHSDLDTIETFGGGGARCLLAECFKN